MKGLYFKIEIALSSIGINHNLTHPILIGNEERDVRPAVSPSDPPSEWRTLLDPPPCVRGYQGGRVDILC